MADEFKAITSQEEFDSAIQARLARERASVSKQYADYDSLKEKAAKAEEDKKAYMSKAAEDAEKIKGLQTALDEANGKIKGFETDALKAKIADEEGLPSALRSRLNGSTEDELRKDAKGLKEILSAENRRGLPSYRNEEPDSNSKDAALKSVLAKLKNE